MKYISSRVLSICVAFSMSGVAVWAQAPVPNAPPSPLLDEERDIPVEYLPSLNTTISFGMRRIGSGPKVNFGQLGAIGMTQPAASFSGRKSYHNGDISLDEPSAREKNAAGTVLDQNQATHEFDATVGGVPRNVRVTITPVYGDPSNPTRITAREVTYASKNTDETTYTEEGRFLGYTAGQARTWNYRHTGQLQTNGGQRQVAMSNYGTQTSGAVASAEGGSAMGFEVQVEQTLRRVGKRFEFGVAGGLSLGDINAKTRGQIDARLFAITDTYNLIRTGVAGQQYDDPTINPNANQPQSRALPDGVSAIAGAVDETIATPISYDAVSSTGEYEIGSGAVIDGYWQIKGHYYLVRLGPTVRYFFNDRFAVSASVGVTCAIVGTQYIVEETLVNVDTMLVVGSREDNETRRLVPGYYADLNAEYWVTERTGFYAGATFQDLGDFEQKPLRGRTAKIKLGDSTGFRLGLMTRF